MGFTLAEMLVAVAVLMILMAGFTMLFTGSVRTVRTAMQQNDAYDQATGALSSIKLDLMSGFNAAGAGNKFSFYGAPTGMTFVGLVRNISPNVALKPLEVDYHLARVTYVLYHDPSVLDVYFPGGFLAEDGSLHDGFTHRMLRYVEPNAADLDSFPVKWNEVYATGSESTTLLDVIDQELQDLEQANPGLVTKDYEESYRRAKKCEFWIRMLSGGDYQVPNAWSNPGTYLGWTEPQIAAGGPVPVLQYVLTDSVATTVPPFTLADHPVPGYDMFPFSGPALFDYDYARPGKYGAKPPNGWWNDPRSINCQNGPGFCPDTCLPEVVSASMWLMFEAPYVNAPNFQKLFHMQVNLPTGYIRQGIISGFVYGATGGMANAVLEEIPDTGNEITTDVSGYYSVAVPYGWSGQIGVVGILTDPLLREYTNVTTHIENQNYDVQ